LYPGAREAYKSITQLSGKGPRNPVRLEGGAVDPVLYSEGGKTKIGFIHDKNSSRRRKSTKAKTYPSNIAPDVVETRGRGRRRRHISLR